MNNKTILGYVFLTIAISLMLTNRHSIAIIFNVAAIVTFLSDMKDQRRK